jgi:hypothetical protein
MRWWIDSKDAVSKWGSMPWTSWVAAGRWLPHQVRQALRDGHHFIGFIIPEAVEMQMKKYDPSFIKMVSFFLAW